MSVKEQICKLVDNKADVFSKVSDDIWANPEMGFQEYKAAGFITDVLKQEGFQVKMSLAGIDTAFSGTFGSGKPVIGFLCEYDCLPGLSHKVCAVRDEVVTGGDGHGCGHNALGAGSLGAAVALKELMEQNNLPGTIVYFGCPGEEFGTGKAFMAREGVFKDVDVALTWHPSNVTGVMGCSSLANICVLFHFTGTAAHAAACPHLGRSALDACELMNVGVNYLREHIIDEARVHYAYQDVGGPAPNVVQNTAELFYYIRAPKMSQAVEIFDRIKKIAEGAALMTETKVDIRVKNACSDYIPNDVVSNILAESMAEIGNIPFSDAAKAFGEEMYTSLSDVNKAGVLAEVSAYTDAKTAQKIVEEGKLCSHVFGYNRKYIAMAGSTDVGDVSYNCPTAQCMVTTAILGTPGHSWQNTAQNGSVIAHEGLNWAAKAMALAGYKVLTNPDVVVKAKEELMSVTGGKYICPIPAEVKPEP